MTTYERQVANVRQLLQPGTAIPAWRLAYVLARLEPAEPTQDAPILIPEADRPPLVIAALRWIGTEAQLQPVSEADEQVRHRGGIHYFVAARVALRLIDQAATSASPWQAMPEVRAVDAAQLRAGHEPRAGVFCSEQLSPTEQDGAEHVRRQVGAVVPSKWQHDQPVDWVSAAQLERLMSGLHTQVGHRNRSNARESLGAARERAILQAIKRLGLQPNALPPSQRGKSGARAAVKKQALTENMPSFGPGDPGKAFDNTWDGMLSSGDLKYADRPNEPA